MKNYKIIIAYDGTDYAGWIQQKNQPSIIQTVHDSFVSVFKKPIIILGASKTDAGVHAMGQVALGKTDIAIGADKMKNAWNNVLPSSIFIRSIEHDEDFHPHHNVIAKTYYYHFFVERPLPFYARYGAHILHPIDIKRFEHALQLFVGTHNFTAFYTGDDRQDTIRTISEIRVEYLPKYNAYRAVIVGQKFLRHMVRRIIGAALACASHNLISEKDIKTALTMGSINNALPTAPAQGLMLYKIEYGNTNEK